MSDYIKREDAIHILACVLYAEASQRGEDANVEDYIPEAKAWMNDAPSAEPKTGWIPVSERLPEAEDMYQPPEQRYLCQLEAYGERKFCVLSRLKGAVSPFWDWYGVAVHDYEVTAWMPLPKPYKGGEEE